MALALLGEVVNRLSGLGVVMRRMMREEGRVEVIVMREVADEPISQCEIYQIMTSQSSASNVTMTSDTNF